MPDFVDIEGLRVPLADDASLSFELDPGYEGNVLRWFRRCVAALERPAVIDVGANFGLFALHAAALGARVSALEPCEIAFRRLCENARRRGDDRITPIRAAVAEAEGTRRLWRYRHTFTNSLFERPVPPESWNAVDGSEDVETVTIDGAIGRGSLPVPAVMKIDVEGADVAVLRGARTTIARSRPLLFVESCAELLELAGTTPAVLLAELERHDYAVFGLGLDYEDARLIDPAGAEVANLVALPDPGVVEEAAIGARPREVPGV